MVAIEVAALYATVELSDGSDRTKARARASQIAGIGALNRGSTVAKMRGRAPSRAKAKNIRLFEASENRPACQTQTRIMLNAAMPPFSPKTSRKIWRTGCGALTVASTSWIE